MKSIIIFFAGVVITVVVVTVVDFFGTPPESEFVSSEAIASKQQIRDNLKPYLWDFISAEPAALNRIVDEIVIEPQVEQARQVYPVVESTLEIDGVYSEVFLPADGVSKDNEQRVLINLHAGGFTFGARTGGRVESIPVASVAKIKVISIDYRQGPEHEFPAANEDVIKVYRHLLKTYPAENIGIYGCSAGGLLTAQSIASMIKLALPVPGAAGIFCAGAGAWAVGDSAITLRALSGPSMGFKFAYMDTIDWESPEGAPINHPEVLAQFPPTMLVTTTRDSALTSAAVTHQRLLAQDVIAELHVFEGLDHAFHTDTSLPESKALFKQIARFFDQQLAR